MDEFAAVRFSIDSMIFDRIADSSELSGLVCKLVEEGQLELVATHIQRDEIAAVTDAERRERLESVPITVVPTYGLVVGVWRAGMARVTGTADTPRYEAVAGQAHKHAPDALILMTAAYEGTTLVTEDRRLRTRAGSEYPSVPVWRWTPFERYLRSLAPSF